MLECTEILREGNDHRDGANKFGSSRDSWRWRPRLEERKELLTAQRDANLITGWVDVHLSPSKSETTTIVISSSRRHTGQDDMNIILKLREKDGRVSPTDVARYAAAELSMVLDLHCEWAKLSDRAALIGPTSHQSRFTCPTREVYRTLSARDDSPTTMDRGLAQL